MPRAPAWLTSPASIVASKNNLPRHHLQCLTCLRSPGSLPSFALHRGTFSNPTPKMRRTVVLQALGSSIGLATCCVVGGIDMVTQAIALAKKPHIVIGTPGRLVDHIENTKGFSLRSAKFLVSAEPRGSTRQHPSMRRNLQTTACSGMRRGAARRREKLPSTEEIQSKHDKRRRGPSHDEFDRELQRVPGVRSTHQPCSFRVAAVAGLGRG